MGKDVRKAAAELLSRCSPLPRVLVLDLDYTVWECWCECYSERDEPPFYPEAVAIIDACREAGMLVAAASRTPTPQTARAWLRKSGVAARFDNEQFDGHSQSKDTWHLPRILAWAQQSAPGVSYADLLFFDDEGPNIRKARAACCAAAAAAAAAAWAASAARAARLAVPPLLLPQVAKLGVTSVHVSTAEGLCLRTLRQGLEQFAAQHAGRG